MSKGCHNNFKIICVLVDRFIGCHDNVSEVVYHSVNVLFCDGGLYEKILAIIIKSDAYAIKNYILNFKYIYIFKSCKQADESYHYTS